MEIKRTQATQQDLFGETSEIQISIKEAAEFASVSQATIRNWIKTGNIHQAPSGLVIKNSLADFKRNEIGGVVAQMPVAAEVGSGDERDELGSG